MTYASKALFLFASLATPAFAASPFDGTWKADIVSAALPAKPQTILLADGVYSCTTCNPSFTVKADGEFHPIANQPYLDEASVKVVDAATITETDYFKGKMVYVATTKISPDGNISSVEWTDYSAPDGKVVTGAGTQTRVAPAPAGAHAISGGWKAATVSNISDAALTVMMTLDGKAFSLKTPNGYGYAAMVDGPAVPITGDLAKTMAQITMPAANTIVETDLRDGKAVSTMTMVVQPGGKIKVANTNLLQETTTTYMLDKQ